MSDFEVPETLEEARSLCEELELPLYRGTYGQTGIDSSDKIMFNIEGCNGFCNESVNDLCVYCCTLSIAIRDEKTLTKKNKPKETKMAEVTIKEVILNHYTKGADAALVSKHFSGEIKDNYTGYLQLERDGKSYLKESQRREEELNAKS